MRHGAELKHNHSPLAIAVIPLAARGHTGLKRSTKACFTRILTGVICALLTERFFVHGTSEATPAFGSIVAPPNLPDLVEKILPGVVNISSTTVINYQVFGMNDFLRLWGVPQERKQTSLGSGFIIDNDGYVLTNNHVVEHASEVLVTLYDKRNFKAKIIGKDEKLDFGPASDSRSEP